MFDIHDDFHPAIMNESGWPVQTHLMLETRARLQTQFVLEEAGSCWRLANLLSLINILQDKSSFHFDSNPKGANMKALIGIIAASALMLTSGYAAADGQALAQKSGCMTCHAVNHKVLGPAFKNVAAKFKSDKMAVADLEHFIKHGGGAMPPQSQLSDADVKALATWIKNL